MNSPEPSANCDNLPAPDRDTNSGPPPLPVTSVAKVLDGQIEQLGITTPEGRGGEWGGKAQADTHVKYEDPATEIKRKASQGKTELEPDSKTIIGKDSQALDENNSVIKPVPKKRKNDFSSENSDDKQKVCERNSSSRSSSSSSSSGSTSSSEDGGNESSNHRKKVNSKSYNIGDNSPENAREISSGGAGISVTIRPDGKRVEYLDPHKFLVKSKDDSSQKILDLSNALKIPVTSVGSMHLEYTDIETANGFVNAETAPTVESESKFVTQESVEQQNLPTDQCIISYLTCEDLTKPESFDSENQVLRTESNIKEVNENISSEERQFVQEMERLSPEEQRHLVVSVVDEPAEMKGFIEYISPISSPKLLFKKVQDLDLKETSVDEDQEKEKSSSSSSSSDSETDSHSKDKSASSESSKDNEKIKKQHSEVTKGKMENESSTHENKNDAWKENVQDPQPILEKDIYVNSVKQDIKDEEIIVASSQEPVRSFKDNEIVEKEKAIAKQLAERIIEETYEKIKHESESPDDSSLAKQSSTSDTSDSEKGAEKSLDNDVNSSKESNTTKSDDLALSHEMRHAEDAKDKDTSDNKTEEENLNKSTSSSASSSSSSKHSEKSEQEPDTGNSVDICVCQPGQNKICENDSWEAVYQAFNNADEAKKSKPLHEEKSKEQKVEPEKGEAGQKDKESDTSKSSASDHPDGYLPDLSGPMVPDESVSPFTPPKKTDARVDDIGKQEKTNLSTSTSSSSSDSTNKKPDLKKETEEKGSTDVTKIKKGDVKESKSVPKPARKHDKKYSASPKKDPDNLYALDSSTTCNSEDKNVKSEKNKKKSSDEDKSVSLDEAKPQTADAVNTSTSTTSSGDSGHSSKKGKSKLFSWPFKRNKKKVEKHTSSSDDKDSEHGLSKPEKPEVKEEISKTETPKPSERILPRTSTPKVKQPVSLSSDDDNKDLSLNTSSEGTSVSVADSSAYSTPTSKRRNQDPETERSFSSHQSSDKRSSLKSTSSSDSGNSTPKASRSESPSSPLNRTYTTADNNTTLNESKTTLSEVSTPNAEIYRKRQRSRSGSSSSQSSKHSETSGLSKDVSKQAFEKPLLASAPAVVSEEIPKPRKRSKNKDKRKDRSVSATSKTSQSEASELDTSIASDAQSQQKKEELKKKKEKEEKKKKKTVDNDTSTCQSETSNLDTSITSQASSVLKEEKEKRKKEKEDRKKRKEEKRRAEKEMAEKEKAEREAEKKQREANKEKKTKSKKEDTKDKKKEPVKEESKQDTIEMVTMEKQKADDKDSTKKDIKKKKEKKPETFTTKTPIPDVKEHTDDKEKEKKKESDRKSKKIKEHETSESKKKEDHKKDKKEKDKEKSNKPDDETKSKEKKATPKSRDQKKQEKSKPSKSTKKESKKSTSSDTSSSSSSSDEDEKESMKKSKLDDNTFEPIKESKTKPAKQQKKIVTETFTRSSKPEDEQSTRYFDSPNTPIVAQEVKTDLHSEDIQKADIQKVDSPLEKTPSTKRNQSETPVRPPRTPKSQKSGKFQKFLPSLRSPTKKEFDPKDTESLTSPRQFDGQYHREDDVTQDVPEKVTKPVEKPKRKSQGSENLQYADAYDGDDHVEPPIYSQPRHFVVVAVDFGTTHSGYAFSFTRDPDHPYMMRRWAGEEAGVVNQKTLTSLLLTPGGEFHSFGYSARSSYLNLVPLEARHWLYFSTFKMELHHNAELNRDTTLVASNGVRFSALKVFAFSLEFFKNHALQQLSDQSGTELLNEDIRWVITVPAIWKAPAKQFMRQAAYEAGMASPSFPEQLLIALEPEAASIFCRRLRMHQLVPEKPIKRPLQPPSRASAEVTNTDPAVTELTVDLNKSRSSSKDTLDSLADELIESQVQGSRYLIVDCGGGTVDITVHELDPSGHIKELHRATGGPYGSVGIDNEFERLLCSIFGIEFVEHYKRKYPMGWVHLMTDFESRKRSASPYKNNSSNVSPPFTFINDYKKHKCDPETTIKRYGDSEIEWSAQGMLRLTPVAMRKLFLPTVTHIKQAVGDVLNHPNAREVKYMFLVGGFAESPILQYEMRQEFGSIIKILIPQEVSLAILKGAVLFGIDPSIVNVRRSRLTYGVGILNRFDPKRHPVSKKVKRDGVDWCTDIFDKYVETDQPVMLGNTVIRSYTPAKSGQVSIVLNIYSSVNPNVKFITDPGVTRCGTLCLSLPMLDNDDSKGATGGAPPPPREIQTRMSFGDTEINVVAIDMAIGRVVKASVDFLGR